MKNPSAATVIASIALFIALTSNSTAVQLGRDVSDRTLNAAKLAVVWRRRTERAEGTQGGPAG